MIYDITLKDGSLLKVIAGSEEEAKEKLIASRNLLGLPTNILTISEEN